MVNRSEELGTILYQPITIIVALSLPICYALYHSTWVITLTWLSLISVIMAISISNQLVSQEQAWIELKIESVCYSLFIVVTHSASL